MIDIIEFEVMGEPVGKGRPRFSTQGGFARAITPMKTANYETLVKFSYAQKHSGFCFEAGKPLIACIEAFFSIPKSASKKARASMIKGDIRPTKKPDADNIIKCILDALNGLAYHDDSQVVGVICQKFYAEVPRTVIKVFSAYDLDDVLNKWYNNIVH